MKALSTFFEWNNYHVFHSYHKSKYLLDHLLLKFPGSSRNCHHFYRKPAGTYSLLTQYPEELTFCQEMCIQHPECVGVGRNGTGAELTCMVLSAPYPCGYAHVWVIQPYELAIS